MQAPAAVGPPTGTLTSVVNDWSGGPAPDALVTVTSDSGQVFQATTDATGTVTFSGIPVGKYTITANLFICPRRSATLTAVPVTANATATRHIELELEGLARSGNLPLMVTCPATGQIATPPPQNRLTSLIVGYNNAFPDHRAGGPYYGRYSYVLLKDGGERSRWLLGELAAASNAVSGSPMGAPTSIHETWRYNLFLSPVWPPAYRLRNAGIPEFIGHYDFTAALNIRRQYCDVTLHASWSVCNGGNDRGLDDGPIVMVFSKPIGGIPYNQPLPPGLVVDLSGVDETQFHHVIEQLQEAMTVQTNHDSLLPLSWTDTVIARAIQGLASALQELIPHVKIYSG